MRSKFNKSGGGVVPVQGGGRIQWSLYGEVLVMVMVT